MTFYCGSLVTFTYV